MELNIVQDRTKYHFVTKPLRDQDSAGKLAAFALPYVIFHKYYVIYSAAH